MTPIIFGYKLIELKCLKKNVCLINVLCSGSDEVDGVDAIIWKHICSKPGQEIVSTTRFVLFTF